jgi:squalene-hopene/tetraprenyl-beta-curcumene cyclase
MPSVAPVGTKADPALDACIERAVDHLLSIQRPDGYWWAELESNVTMAAEHLLLTHFLGVRRPEQWDKLVAYMRRGQNEDGSWSVWYGGPGDLSCTIEAYFALKLAGASPDESYMQRARQFILSQGGMRRARVFTKLWLALFGQFEWQALPAMPPEVILLPARFPFNIYEFASWARATMVPILVVWAHRPVCPIPDEARVDELYVRPEDRRTPEHGPRPTLLSWRSFFLGADRALRLAERSPWKPLRRMALRRAERWILEHQEADGSWGGIQPPWVYSLIALRCLGHGLDHPAMARSLKGWEDFSMEDEETFHVQACVSPVWDTPLAVIALREAGLPPDHPALLRAGRWLLRRQVLTGGDWQVKSPTTPPGGWPFEFANDNYPDADDTAVIMMALRGLQLEEQDDLNRALDRGLHWLLGMQSGNGGWGAFDKDNTRRFVTQIPFCDFGEVIDPPSEDVTAHVVELLGSWGFDAEDPALKRALAYLWSTQDPEGPWFGRWGVNYIYGTAAVLPALAAAGQDMNDERVRRAVRWLAERQNPDGGWGEACESYLDPSMRGCGPSTASQTAWALLALMAAGEAGSESARRGVDYLMRTQAEDGAWDEPYFTGTGFPVDFMLKYHMYRVYFPLMALGRYRRLTQGVAG